MKKALSFIWVFLLTFLMQSAFGQGEEFSKIDDYARKIPVKHTASVKALNTYLTAQAINDVEKIRSFYVWIAENIEYDLNALSTPNTNSVKPEEVLRRKKAVCEGYSSLFKALCDESNIPCKIIPGYSKGYGYKRGKKFSEEDHAWNAVFINNEWQLIDVTWGAGGILPNNTFKKVFQEEYFLSDKSFFLTEHLPLNPVWQLIDCPISLKVFEKDNDVILKELQEPRSPCMDYQKEILKQENLTEIEKDIYIARLAYEFNPENHRYIGYAYMNTGYLLAIANSQNEVSLKERLESEQKVLEHYEKAIEYLRKSKSPETKNLILNCNHNIAVSKTNIKTIKKALEQN